MGEKAKGHEKSEFWTFSEKVIKAEKKGHASQKKGH